MFLELPILTKIPTITCFIIALSRHHSVETSLTTVIGDVGMLEASLLLSLWAAKTWLHLIIFWCLALSVHINIFPYKSEELQTLSKILEPLWMVF